MSSIGGPNIIENGLISYLDAGNNISYPGSGTVVYDLSKNGKNGTLINGTTVLTSNLGVFSFDGTNDTIQYGTGNTFFPLYQFTLEIWVKSPGLGVGQSIGGIWGFTYGIRVYINSNGTVRFEVNNNTGGGTGTIPLTTSSNTFFNNTWYHLVVQNNGTTSYIYVNGVLNASTAATWTGTTAWPTNIVSIGRDQNNSMYYLYGQLALPKIYNRALTPEEVLQNYNATKGRFGL